MIAQTTIHQRQTQKEIPQIAFAASSTFVSSEVEPGSSGVKPVSSELLRLSAVGAVDAVGAIDDCNGTQCAECPDIESLISIAAPKGSSIPLHAATHFFLALSCG